jgi:hypothetical protein
MPIVDFGVDNSGFGTIYTNDVPGIEGVEESYSPKIITDNYKKERQNIDKILASIKI